MHIKNLWNVARTVPKHFKCFILKEKVISELTFNLKLEMNKMLINLKRGLKMKEER